MLANEKIVSWNDFRLTIFRIVVRKNVSPELLGQQSFDLLYNIVGLWLDGRSKASCHGTIFADKKLLEVPTDFACSLWFGFKGG